MITQEMLREFHNAAPASAGALCWWGREPSPQSTRRNLHVKKKGQLPPAVLLWREFDRAGRLTYVS